MEGVPHDPFVLFSYMDVPTFPEPQPKPVDPSFFVRPPTSSMFIPSHPSPMQSPVNTPFLGVVSSAPMSSVSGLPPSCETSCLIQDPTPCFPIQPLPQPCHADPILGLPSPQAPRIETNVASMPTPPEVAFYMPPTALQNQDTTKLNNPTPDKSTKMARKRKPIVPLPYAPNMLNINLAPPRRIVKPPTSQAPRPTVPYECDFPGCQKTFTRPYNLKSHRRTHTSERPFACPHCSRCFARQHDRNRHAKLHLGIRPYICHFCTKAFARQDALNRHQRIDPSSPHCLPACALHLTSASDTNKECK